MLNPEENKFIEYWEKNRDRQKKTFRQLLLGIPIGMLFTIPILVNFMSGWYKRADMEANSGEFSPVVLAIAILLIAGFVAIFYKKFQWDQKEQYYKELKAKQEADEPPEKKTE